MAYIRRVRTASGATAVQIAEYADGRERVVEHVGSSHTVAELGVLLERARELLVDPAQEMFDFEVEAVPRTARLMSAPAEPMLLDEPRRDGPADRDGTGRVVGTASGVLFDALAGVFAELGFDALGDTVFRDLVLARIVEPTSLSDTGRVLSDLGRTPAAYATMKRTLARCTSGKYRDQIASLCFTHAVTSGDVSLCLYDVTTLYFEAEKEDELRKVGYSKERRVDPQIVVGLLVDRHGFPLEIGCFEGDKAETLTIVPIVKQFAARHDLAHMVVVADAGMLSTKNLDEIAGEGLFFIVGSRATKAPIDLESHFGW
ncbi:MAG: IS1634 family transposase, partial [Actinomycetes bacterium]